MSAAVEDAAVEGAAVEGAVVEATAVEGAAVVEVDSVSVPVAGNNEIFEFCTVQCKYMYFMYIYFMDIKNRIMIIQNMSFLLESQ